MASYMYIFCPQLRIPTYLPTYLAFLLSVNYPISAILQGNETVFCDVKRFYSKREEENGC